MDGYGSDMTRVHEHSFIEQHRRSHGWVGENIENDTEGIVSERENEIVFNVCFHSHSPLKRGA